MRHGRMEEFLEWNDDHDDVSINLYAYIIIFSYFEWVFYEGLLSLRRMFILNGFMSNESCRRSV